MRGNTTYDVHGMYIYVKEEICRSVNRGRDDGLPVLDWTRTDDLSRQDESPTTVFSYDWYVTDYFIIIIIILVRLFSGYSIARSIYFVLAFLRSS